MAASVAALESNGADFSYAPRNIVKESGEFQFRENPGIGTFAELMPFCHHAMFTRKDILLAHHGFDDKTYRSAADYDLIMRILLRGEYNGHVNSYYSSFLIRTDKPCELPPAVDNYFRNHTLRPVNMVELILYSPTEEVSHEIYKTLYYW